MPVMQVTINALNERFGPGSDRIGGLDLVDFEEQLSLSEIVVERLGIGPEYGSEFVAHLDRAPEAISWALKAILRSAIGRGHPVTLVWMPGYEWELTVTDTEDAAKTPGGISILVRSRYPTDPIPDTVHAS